MVNKVRFERELWVARGQLPLVRTSSSIRVSAFTRFDVLPWSVIRELPPSGGSSLPGIRIGRALLVVLDDLDDLVCTIVETDSAELFGVRLHLRAGRRQTNVSQN